MVVRHHFIEGARWSAQSHTNLWKIIRGLEYLVQGGWSTWYRGVGVPGTGVGCRIYGAGKC